MHFSAERILRSLIKYELQRRMLILAIAIKRFELQKGKSPESLYDLVLDTLSAFLSMCSLGSSSITGNRRMADGCFTRPEWTV